jgi:hypothetical protein
LKKLIRRHLLQQQQISHCKKRIKRCLLQHFSSSSTVIEKKEKGIFSLSSTTMAKRSNVSPSPAAARSLKKRRHLL